MIARDATELDIPDACDLLNEIIAIGGTTAYQKPLSVVAFSDQFLTGDNCISCCVCESGDGEIIGFQSLSKNQHLEEDWADIATFARAQRKVRGVGTLLFSATIQKAQTSGVKTINATIRADNVSGLAYYEKMGFAEYSVEKSVRLLDGTPVDRISKKYSLVYRAG